MRRRVRQRWHGMAWFGVTHYTALGDRSFALKKQLGDRLEFKDSTGIDAFFGGSSPGGMFDLGLRFSIAFGPLNRVAWENELGVPLQSSSLFTMGPAALWHPLAGSRIDPYVGVEWLLTNIGTSQTASEDVCDDTGCDSVSVDVPFVKYNGWSFGYLAGVRFFLSSRGRPWWVHLEAKYLQSNWTSLETDLGTRPEDVSQMKLNQFGVTLGIGVAL